MEPGVPCITLVDPALSHGDRLLAALAQESPFAALASLLEALREAPGAGWRSIAKALIEEGERFSRTPAGERWCKVLGGSHLVHNGWVLWNQLNADFYVRNAPPLGEHPVALLRETLRELEQADLESLVRQLSDAAIAIDAQLHAGEAEIAPFAPARPSDHGRATP